MYIYVFYTSYLLRQYLHMMVYDILIKCEV